MSKIQTGLQLMLNPFKSIRILGHYGLLNWIPDKLYLRLLYRAELGKKLNLESPVTYNEKLQWLKLFDRKPEYTKMADKYEVRKYIAETIGKEHLIPLLAVYESPDEINFEELPDQFAIKCTHGSGCNIICSNKSLLDLENAKRKIAGWMKHNWYWFGREWVYKHIKPRIICEKYMVDESRKELKDYKLMCFNGTVKCVLVCTNRYIKGKFNMDFYDMDWNKMPFERHHPNSNVKISKPVNFNLMVKYAKILSKDIPFARIDFYEVFDKLYFGEITFYPGCGLLEFTPEYYDKLIGSWIKLPHLSDGRM